MFVTSTDNQGNTVLKKRADIRGEASAACKQYAEREGDFEIWTAREALDERDINPLVDDVKFAFGH